MNENGHPVVLNYESFSNFHEDLKKNEFTFSRNAARIMAAYLPMSENLRRNVVTRAEIAAGIYGLLDEGKLEAIQYKGRKIIHKGNLETTIHDIVAKEQKEGDLDDTQLLVNNVYESADTALQETAIDGIE